MANFGLSELRIVEPRDGWPNDKALAAASGADQVIDGAAVFDALGPAIADLHFVYATTARPRGMIKTVLDPGTGRRRHAGADRRRGSGSASSSGASAGASTMTRWRLPTSSSPPRSIPPSPRSTSPRRCCWSAMNGTRSRPPRSARRRRAAGARRAGTADARHPPRHQGGALRFFRAIWKRSSTRAGFYKTAEKKPGMVRNMRNLFFARRAHRAGGALAARHGRARLSTRPFATEAGEARDGAPRILLFDSGMGGLTVARAVRGRTAGGDPRLCRRNAAFPYGAWDEDALVARIVEGVGALIARIEPDARGHRLQHRLDAGAAAAARGLSRCPSSARCRRSSRRRPRPEPASSACWRRPARCQREYTQALIHTYAFHCKVFLHGATRLAEIAEAQLAGAAPDHPAIAREIAPVFRLIDGGRTDVVVLGCTHYPLLLPELRIAAPWPVTFIDPAPAIARRTAAVRGGPCGSAAGAAKSDAGGGLLHRPPRAGRGLCRHGFRPGPHPRHAGCLRTSRGHHLARGASPLYMLFFGKWHRGSTSAHGNDG